MPAMPLVVLAFPAPLLDRASVLGIIFNGVSVLLQVRVFVCHEIM
jgi:hypothetical protein